MRKMTRASLTLLAVAAMVFGLTVAPATADHAGVAVFHGTATTSKIWAPGLDPNSNPIPPDGSWEFVAPDVAGDFCVAVGLSVSSGEVAADDDCFIDSAGLLTHVLHDRSHPLPDGTIPHLDLAGPYCGISQGDGGEGKFESDIYEVGRVPFVDAPSRRAIFSLTDVGWITSAGGTLPVTGDWEESGHGGLLVALVQAQGGTPCFDTSDAGGAENFTVLGVAALIPTD